MKIQIAQLKRMSRDAWRRGRKIRMNEMKVKCDVCTQFHECYNETYNDDSFLYDMLHAIDGNPG